MRVQLHILAGIVICFVLITCSDSGLEPQFEPAILVKHIEPGYPRLARDAGLEGEVEVRFTITITGVTENVVVSKSSGQNAGFEESSVFAVKQWEYIPAKWNGRAVQSMDSPLIVFKLSR